MTPEASGVAEKDVGVPGEREHTFLDACAARVVETDHRRAHLHRQVHDLDDLGGVGFGEGSAEDGEVLRERVGEPTGDATVACDHAVARHNLILHAEVAAAVGDEGVELFESIAVEEQKHALARGQLTRVALALQPLFPTAQRGRR
jgi:hypothetical protein